MDKALNLWVDYIKRKYVPIDGDVLHQKAMSPYEDFGKGSSETSHTKPFTAS